MLNLLYINPEPFREGRASHTHVNEIILALKTLGCEVELIYPHYSDRHFQNILTRLYALFVLNIKAMRKQKAIYYMRWHFALFPLVLFLKLTNKKYILEVNGKVEDLFIAWPFTKKFKRFFSYLMVSQFKGAAAIISVTPALKKYCEGLEPKNLNHYLVPNGANIDLFNSKAKNLDLPENIALPKNFGILFGSLTQWQGIDYLLDVVENENWPQNFKILFIGEGTEQSKIIEKAKSNNNIIYMPKISYKLLPRIIARAKISFILGTNVQNRAQEGLAPLKLFESLSCGVPVISTRRPFQEELVRDNECGLFFEENSTNELIDKINYFLENEAIHQKMGENGENLIRNAHSWQIRGEETFKILRQVHHAKYPS